MKTIQQALIDEIIYPLPEGLVENILIKRGLDGDDYVATDVFLSKEYKGCFADCLVALVQAVSFSESDKSVGVISDSVKKSLLARANAIYRALGEDEILDDSPKVYINC